VGLGCELLWPASRRCFARLGVCVGGGSLAAVEAVCGGWELGVGSWGAGATPPTPISQLPTPILDELSTLLDNSLLWHVVGADGEPRFVMLETIREFALEQLDALDEAETIRRQHATSFMQLAEAADAQARGL